ncbi:hypothetical protein [Streptomyces sp. B21-083]|uniref:hypothetical protein n=1 Tax=Streptomyces sp. B21-083 TaxID=3039410 RepID=UPI002FF2FA9A
MTAAQLPVATAADARRADARATTPATGLVAPQPLARITDHARADTRTSADNDENPANIKEPVR